MRPNRSGEITDGKRNKMVADEVKDENRVDMSHRVIFHDFSCLRQYLQRGMEIS